MAMTHAVAVASAATTRTMVNMIVSAFDAAQ